MSVGHYDVALVCLNGHEINSRVREYPQFNETFCSRCGKSTISACPNCQSPIKGAYDSPGVISLSPYVPPQFCSACGKPYPWTRAKLMAARDLADSLQLSDQEKKALKKSIVDVVENTPQATVAASRFKQLVTKGGQWAADGFREILVGVISDVAKKQMGL